ncbi:hypothetical protein [Kordiimonas lacus]|uniref:Uncharacterized protein n=1 Tax=Kordiimonas lacus TaxID=637679 RepID=A0A1G6TC04_9PROT|nr:hypothetical protein [Kordiimonas lacus]SDD25825.1 hypothetical protein SAMN04488071_0167 [Kordiimonas lacus]
MRFEQLRGSIAKWFLPAFMLASSIILLVVGVPRFLHEHMLVPGTPILYRVNAGEKVSDEDLETLEQSRLDALAFTELPDAYYDLGSSYLRRAQTATNPETVQKYSEMAIEASMAGLKMAPLNTFAWFRVATANVMLGPEKYQESLKAWRTSIATARFEPFILMQRVHLGIILYQDMADEDVLILKDQLTLAYQWNKVELRQYVHRNHLIIWIDILFKSDSEMKDYLIR